MFTRKVHHVIFAMFAVFLLSCINFACAPKSAPPTTPSTPPGEAVFQVSNLSIAPTEVSPGEKVTITVEVINTGDIEGTHTVELKVNDSHEAEESVTLAAKASKTVTFILARDIEDVYKITVDGLSKELTVKRPIKIQYLAHSSFLITSSTGLKIITDPYAVISGVINYSPINETADIVTVSHEDIDHNNVTAVKGNPEVVKGVGVKNVKGIQFKGIDSYHDEAKTRPNTIICFSVDGAKFCHLGDLGLRLSPEQIAEIGDIDVLFIPVGGFFTINANTATEVSGTLKPKIIIPMHYRTSKVGGDLSNLSSVEDFLQGKENVTRLNTSNFEFEPGNLPTVTEIVVLEPAK